MAPKLTRVWQLSMEMGTETERDRYFQCGYEQAHSVIGRTDFVQLQDNMQH